MEIQGTFYFSKSTKSCPSTIQINGNEIKVFTSDGELLLDTVKNAIKVNIPIPGLANSLSFADGSSFIPTDKSIRWSFNSVSSKFTEKLMNNLQAIVIISLSCPLIIWLLVFKAIPNISENAAELMPEIPKSIIGDNLLMYFEDYYLEESSINSQKKIKIENLFFNALNKLGLNKEDYKILFYKSDTLGANALALPNGTIILTDSLVDKLIIYPDSLLAILLHEVGHIEKNHGLRLIIQSLGVGVIFTYLVGDVQGLTEMVTGSGLGLLQASFSREMEIEADRFSVDSLNTLEISKEKFIFAIETIILDKEGEEQNNLFLKYLSTHPHIESRIALAKRP